MNNGRLLVPSPEPRWRTDVEVQGPGLRGLPPRRTGDGWAWSLAPERYASLRAEASGRWDGFSVMVGMKFIFLIFHGSGTMLGKATYGNFFVALQGCTIGAHHGKYPTLGQGVALAAQSSIIGPCQIGHGASVSCQTGLFQTDVPDHHVAYRDKEGRLIIKPSARSYAQTFFNVDCTPPQT